ncbi:hypothetical protein GLYMA_07G020800v4 [Glycine max]|uniref:Ubiquitin-specific protease family C19-related protein n=2 Tax=Glycine subgen. Soja TaxID=1462606 RepID=K7KZ51_SOYBN|nr:uncharacterized membrane protein At1g16860 isoform X2 [Glycine max]XP_028238956.1 uncharacterized membrane protein At1g16860-like isoform X2 [Glycine soja]XP_040873141.1 uncharacterized membrane protein At1g16860 isoform X2 [Glycine max]KRH47296.1 hypothetical protein GLYMA_07G020800v4 [Glycine max]RZC00960.1 putative membrane protein isoform B [Glycine soja]|eukprot:XP_006583076.1 uncharacterized membrane protein At1g16860 isoform X2 [Glycine max]
MGSRIPSHKLSNGLYVSGRPEQPKERTPTMTSTAVPYTGGDIKKSGELGKMFDIPVDGSKSRKSGPITGAPSRTGSFGGAGSHSGPMQPNAAARATYTSGPMTSGGMAGSTSMKKSNSGPLNKHGEPVKKSSGPQSGGVTPVGRQNSGPLAPVLPTTGLITSGPISSGPLNSSGAPRKVSGPLEATGSMKLQGSAAVHNQAVTVLSQVAASFTWNTYWGRRSIMGFVTHYPDSELRTAKNGQFVKVSGVVTCGNVPLESSFQKVPRCVYTSTSLYEYRGWDSKAANPAHRRLTWGLRLLERRVVDFYISDFQSGLRALVKTGHGARVTPYVDDSVLINVNPTKEELSPEFLRWLGERNLSSDDRIMRLEEGYIKEGSTVSVMGVVQRNENVLMIVPPPDPITTGCQWTKCIFPSSLEGIVLRCEDASKNDVIPV